MPTLVDREAVQGTEQPVIYIGHRLLPTRNGTRKAARTWHAEYCTDGRQRYLSLKVSNKNRAISAAHELAQRLQRNEEPTVRRRIELSEIVKEYLELQRNRGRAPKTLEKYEYVLNTLVAWAEENQRPYANSFNSKDFWAFNRKMTDEKKSSKTRADRLTIIKQLFKWAANENMLPSNPIAREELPKATSAKQPCFTPEQVAKLLENADPHEGAIFSVMAFAGLRFGEVQQLRWTNLILPEDGNGCIVVENGGSADTTKSKETRRIPVHPELRKVINRLPRSFQTVFTARPSTKFPNGDGLISERRLLVSLKRLCRRVNFVDPDQYKLHTFRHAFCSMLARNNVSYKYALEFMGHRSSDILDIYYTMFDKDAQAAIGGINYPFEGFTNAPAA